MPHERWEPIGRVSVRAVDVPLARAIVTAAGTMPSVPAVVVEVMTADGIAGVSYLRTYTRIALRATVQLAREVADLVKGLPVDPASIRQTLRARFRLLGSDGLVGAVIAAFDMALWDRYAKAHELSLARALGSARTSVPAYASLSAASARDAAREAEELVGRGFRAVKLKGTPDLRQTLAAAGAVRAAVGPEISLLVDFNQALGVQQVLARAREVDRAGLYWIEEPTQADDLVGHALLADALATPVQLGENLRSTNELDALVRVGGVDHLAFDVQRIGGVSGWRDAAETAGRSGIPVSSHAFGEFSRHLLAASPTSHLFEFLDHMERVVEEPIRVEDGEVVLPDRPGAGLAFDERALRRYEVAT